VCAETVVNAAVRGDPVLNKDRVVCISAGIPVAERFVEYVFFSLHGSQLELFLASCQ
jgi:hypothetical protein